METKASHKNFKTFLDQVCSEYSDNVALTQLRGESFKNMTYGELHQHSYRLAKFLIERGIKKGDRVVIISEHRLEWPVGAFGSLLSGAILVPLDPLLSPSEIAGIINHCDPVFVLFSRELNSKITTLSSKLEKKIPLMPLDFDQLEEISDYKHIKIEEPADGEIGLIVYTSGTSGAPKGVMIKSESILYELSALVSLFRPAKTDTFLSMLPVNHLFEFTGGLCLPLFLGDKICIANSHDKEHISLCLNTHQVTQIVTVPLFIAKIKNGIENAARSSGFLKPIILSVMLKIASILPWKIRRSLFSKIIEKFGGKLERFLIGSAPASREVIDFFNKLGIEVCEGYGLSETSPVVSVNSPVGSRPGSVGLPIPGVEVEINSPDESGIGEICVKGPIVFEGYYKNDELTKEVLDEDGRFYTGDLGYFDSDGYLYITGRKKKMIILDGGKKVYPEEVETFFSNVEEIGECALAGVEVGDINKQVNVVLLVYPSSMQEGESKVLSQDYKDELIHKLRNLSNDLTSFKRPQHYIILDQELPKTSTMKIKFNEVQKIAQNLMDETTL